MVEFDRRRVVKKGEKYATHTQQQEQPSPGPGQVQTDDNRNRIRQQRPRQYLLCREYAFLNSPAASAERRQFPVARIVARDMVKVVIAHVKPGVDADSSHECQDEIS